MNQVLFFILIFLTGSSIMNCQDSKIIEIRKAGSSKQDESLYPGANILLKGINDRVNLYHDGALIISDKAIFYNKSNFFEAEGNILFTQGDSLTMTCSNL